MSSNTQYLSGSASPSQTKKIGLALGSGGPRGLAHIGVIQALVEHSVPIDIIVGSSAGSLIGGLFAAHRSIDKVLQIAKSFTYKDLLLIFSDIGVPTGIIRGNAMEAFLDKVLFHSNIESLSVPFAAVATDAHSGDAIVIREGNLARAIRMSSAIPGVFEVGMLDERYVMDGGASYPVPVPVAKHMGASHVIAVNLDTYHFLEADVTGKRRPSIPDVSIAALRLLQHNLSKELCRGADVTIMPEVASVSSINLAEFLHPDAIIQMGYKATIESMPVILSVIK